MKKGQSALKTIERKALVAKLLKALDDVEIKEIVKNAKPDTVLNVFAKLIPTDMNVTNKKDLSDYTAEELQQYLITLKEKCSK